MSKKCIRCGIDKSLDNFKRDPRSKKEGYNKICRPCINEDKLLNSKNIDLKNEISICKTCNISKPFDYFDIDKLINPKFRTFECLECFDKKIIKAPALKKDFVTFRELSKILKLNSSSLSLFLVEIEVSYFDENKKALPNEKSLDSGLSVAIIREIKGVSFTQYLYSDQIVDMFKEVEL